MARITLQFLSAQCAAALSLIVDDASLHAVEFILAQKDGAVRIAICLAPNALSHVQAWGIAPGIQSSRKQALKACFNGPEMNRAFSALRFGIHESWGDAQAGSKFRAFGAKHIPDR